MVVTVIGSLPLKFIFKYYFQKSFFLCGKGLFVLDFVRYRFAKNGKKKFICKNLFWLFIDGVFRQQFC